MTHRAPFAAHHHPKPTLNRRVRREGTVLRANAGPVIEKAYGAGPCSGHLSDIEHFVFLLQENRSFDHYFGTLSGVNGFNTPSPAFQQKGWNPQNPVD